jgi:hypothetical protein
MNALLEIELRKNATTPVGSGPTPGVASPTRASQLRVMVVAVTVTVHV